MGKKAIYRRERRAAGNEVEMVEQQELVGVWLRLTQEIGADRYAMDLDELTASFDFCTLEEKRKVYRAMARAWMWGQGRRKNELWNELRQVEKQIAKLRRK